MTEDRYEQYKGYEVNTHNEKLMNEGQPDNANVYICIRCRQLTSYDEAYSNRGRNLHCCRCVDEAAVELNINKMTYIQRIWNS